MEAASEDGRDGMDAKGVGEGHGSDPMATRLALRKSVVEALELESPEDERRP
jgi:hypothetical protein